MDNIFTIGGVVQLIKHGFRIGYWIYWLRLQVTTKYIHLEQFLPQILISTAVHWRFSGDNWTDSSSWSNQMARLARLLNSNSTCLWTAPLTLELLLTVLEQPSYCSVELLHTVLLNLFLLFFELPLAVLFSLLSFTSLGSGLWRPRVDRKEITDCPCWNVIVDSLQQHPGLYPFLQKGLFLVP
jgi:hypothetical protein